MRNPFKSFWNMLTKPFRSMRELENRAKAAETRARIAEETVKNLDNALIELNAIKAERDAWARAMLNLKAERKKLLEEQETYRTKVNDELKADHAKLLEERKAFEAYRAAMYDEIKADRGEREADHETKGNYKDCFCIVENDECASVDVMVRVYHNGNIVDVYDDIGTLLYSRVIPEYEYYRAYTEHVKMNRR